MTVKFNGNPVTLEGKNIKVGDIAPAFILKDNALNDVKLSDTKGKRVFVSLPSIDTEVCDMEVRRFNKEAASFPNTTIYVVSMDLPFAQSRWCGNAGIESVKTLSDYKDRSFGMNYGTYIKELGLLARAVFVVDESNKVTYVEYCEEVTKEPNYEKVLEVIKA